MSEMPVVALPTRPCFMVIDGKTYLVDKIEQSPDDMLKHVEQYYKDNMEELREKMTQHISQESQDDLNKQVTRIERHLASGIVALPEGLRDNGTVLFLQQNKVYASRIVLFRPSRLSCTLQHMNNIIRWVDLEISRRDAERFTKFLEWARPLRGHYQGLNTDPSSIKIDIRFTQDLFIYPMVVSHITEENLLYVQPDGVHPHVHRGSRNLCTGNTPAQVFWDDALFIDNFNSLNPHSWANSGVPIVQEYRNFLKNQYFTDGRVRTEEVSAWRV